MAGTGGRALSAALVGILIARSLGPARRGEVAFVVTTAGLAASVSVGIITPFVLRQRNAGASSLHRLGLGMSVRAWVAVTPILLAAGVAVHGRRGLALGVAAAALALPQLLLTALIFLEQLHDRMARLALVTLAGGAVNLVVVAGLAGTGRLDVLGALVAVALSVVAPLAALFIIDGRTWLAGRCESPRLRPTPAASGRLELALPPLLLLLVWRSDVVVVASILGFHDLGIYAVAVAAAELVSVGLAGVRSSITPRIAALDDPAAPIELFGRLNQVALVALAIVSAVLLAAGHRLFAAVYGAPFGAAAAPALVLVPGIWGYNTALNYIESLQVSGASAYLSKAFTAGLVINVAGNILLAPRYGVVVPAATSSAAYLLCAAAVLAKAARLSDRPVQALLFPFRMART